MEETIQDATTTGLKITILESSREHLLIRWVDSRRCHYGEQRWRLSMARRRGYCAISGLSIHRGQPVFRPIGRPPPVNYLAMITPQAVFQLD
ncbi:DUF3331 domain-containing protein [Paraburkholderia sp. J63]|uniref:DUF3331 domain-containing protein n=1 Tax=Paraburkholderia sp. J63 TaxID=2805434 RepID=UPI002ABDD651|nr:DUF3331 domain-containing protein [Paraburkholderia sp. J63]